MDWSCDHLYPVNYPNRSETKVVDEIQKKKKKKKVMIDHLVRIYISPWPALKSKYNSIPC
jgi:hypothetical protein